MNTRLIVILLSSAGCALTMLAVAAPKAHRFTGREVRSEGAHERRVSAPGALKAPVLSGFSFTRESSDAQVEQTSLVFHSERGTLDAILLSQRLSWEARFVEPQAGETGRIAGHCTGGDCTQLLALPSDKAFLLSGFRFRFRNGRHDLKTIKILESNGVLKVSFADKNGDDPFDWGIYYTLIPRSAIRKSGQVSGTAKGSVTQPLQLPRNGLAGLDELKPVLTGFSLNFKDGDHQIEELGVILESRTALIKFNDKNDDDAFAFVIEYAWLG